MGQSGPVQRPIGKVRLDCHCHGGLFVRKLLAAAMAASVLAVSASAPATVVPPTPEQIIMMKKREALENRARAAMGDHGLIEKLREWRDRWGWILVGEEGGRGAPRLLVKDEHGWFEMRPGETRRLPVQLGMELNRLLHREDLWQEDAYNFHARCTQTPKLFVVMHAGRDTFGRLGCGPEGIAARVARTADSLRVLSGEAKTTAPPREQRPHPPGAPPEYFEASNQVSAQIFEMAAAFERKTLGGFVEPFAPDVILEGPFGTYQGRKMAVDWARSLQDWKAAYADGDRRLRVERIVTKNQEAKHVFYTQHEFRWEEAGNPVRQTFSTMWRNHDGLWLIAHQKMSEVKPASGERIPW